jgi:prepilin-type processing-associated H-X9-DG protein
MWLALAAAGISCTGIVGDASPDFTLLVPPRNGFESVADAMQPSCGTLDCHGQPDRNLRLYGGRGLRLDPVKASKDGDTDPAEYDHRHNGRFVASFVDGHVKLIQDAATGD